jgi:Rrf2 family transcriptional regulator, nitric oxide-sensitive transcriptional repressor
MAGVSDHMEEPLRLSLQTDLALRSLMYLAANDGRARVSTSHIAQRFRVSKFHLQKAVQALRKLGYVGSTSGRFGGLSLAVPASGIRIGSVVAALESMGHLVNCNKGPCPLDGACLLKLALDRAERAFFLELDQYSLADMVRGPTANVLDMLLSA